MNILHVFSTMAVGGAQVRFAQLVDALPGRYRHRVISMDGQFDSLSRLAADAPVEPIPLAYRKEQTLRSLLLFRRKLARLRPDLLITYNWGAIEWGLVNLPLPVCPHITILDGFGPDEAQGSLPNRVRLRRLIYGRAAAVVVPSRTLERLATQGWGLAPDLIRYIPNGIDLGRFGMPPDAELLHQLGISPRERLVGTVTTLRAEKNLPRLLEAFRTATEDGETANARLLIIGDGPERAGLTERAAALGLADRVVFAGHVDRPERLLAALSVYAISSDTEQMPISLIEAMAAALPIASVDVGDIAAMVAPENRRFVQGTDAAALARSLRMLLADPAASQTLGQANAETARTRFDEASMVDAYDALFAQSARVSAR